MKVRILPGELAQVGVVSGDVPDQQEGDLIVMNHHLGLAGRSQPWAEIAERFDKVRTLIAEGRKAEAHKLLQCCREGRRCER